MNIFLCAYLLSSLVKCLFMSFAHLINRFFCFVLVFYCWVLRVLMDYALGVKFKNSLSNPSCWFFFLCCSDLVISTVRVQILSCVPSFCCWILITVFPIVKILPGSLLYFYTETSLYFHLFQACLQSLLEAFLQWLLILCQIILTSLSSQCWHPSIVVFHSNWRFSLLTNDFQLNSEPSGYYLWDSDLI